MNTHYRTFAALGTTVQLCITTTTAEDANNVMRQLYRTVLRFEKNYSRFLPASQLTQLNKRAGTKWWVSDEMADILTKARDIGIQTGGLYNPFILPALQQSGYIGSRLKDYASDPAIDYTSRTVVPVTELDIGDGWARIPLRSALDLGGCGKGYVGDLLADIADQMSEIVGYWFSVGGDIVARGVHETGEVIAIAVQGEDDTPSAYVSNNGDRFAVATSTTKKRQGVYHGTAWHHIIDPRTGKPSDSDIETATIYHPSLFAADVHASNIVIVGTDSMSHYLTEQHISDAIAYARDGQYYGCGTRLRLDKSLQARYHHK